MYSNLLLLGNVYTYASVTNYIELMMSPYFRKPLFTLGRQPATGTRFELTKEDQMLYTIKTTQHVSSTRHARYEYSKYTA